MSWINTVVHGNCTEKKRNHFSHIYMHEPAHIHDRFTLQNRFFNAKCWPKKTTKPNPAAKGNMLFQEPVASESVAYLSGTSLIGRWTIFERKPSVLQRFAGRWSVSGIYLQQVRQKVNKFLVWALQVAPQRGFLWDQILQLICLLVRVEKVIVICEVLLGLLSWCKHFHINWTNYPNHTSKNDWHWFIRKEYFTSVQFR